MAVPKYTAQLADQLRLKKSQAIMALILVDVVPIMVVQLLVTDQELMRLVFIPIWHYFWKWMLIIYSVIIVLQILSLNWRINQLSDNTEK